MPSVNRVLIVLAFAVVVALPSVGAWSNGGYSADQSNPDYGTHDWIADMALNLQTRDVDFLKTTYHAKFLLGTEAPDNPDFIGDTSKHHVYFASDHQLEDDACAVRAAALYQGALGYLKSENYDVAAYDVGVMAHYIADVGVFGHTMGAYTDWGTETHHSDYENEFEARLDSLSTPTGISLGNSDAFNATVELAEDITFGSGAIRANTWMDANYNWAEASFVSSALTSLNRSVAAVASAINHLLIEAGSSIPTPDPIPSTAPPQPPSSVIAVVDGSDIRLSWSPPSSDGGAAITGYLIYRSTTVDNPVRVATLLASNLSWTDESALQGRTYYYWVVAKNSAGQSGMSQVASVATPKDSDSLVLPLIVLTISIALASSGALLWRRRSRNRQRS